MDPFATLPQGSCMQNTDIGVGNQLISVLIRTILAAQCALTPKDMWPQDYGVTALEKGTYMKPFNRHVFDIANVDIFTVSARDVYGD